MRPAPCRSYLRRILLTLTPALSLVAAAVSDARAQTQPPTQTPPASYPAGAGAAPQQPATGYPGQPAPAYPGPTQAQPASPPAPGQPGQPYQDPAGQPYPAQPYPAAPGQPDQGAPGQPYQAAPGQTYQPPGTYPYPGQQAQPYAAPPGYGAPPAYQPPPGGYPPPPPYGQYRAPGAETHDGFYLRMHLGGGYTTTRASTNGVKESLSGGSAAFGLALGGAVSPNLIIYGSFAMTTISDPDYKQNGVTEPYPDAAATTFGMGVGAAYYLMPMNVYLAGTVMATQFQLTDERLDSGDDGYVLIDTNRGIGFEALVGKEWWISENWGLGGALQFLLGTSKEKMPTTAGATPTWTTTALSLVFSATYN